MFLGFKCVTSYMKTWSNSTELKLFLLIFHAHSISDLAQHEINIYPGFKNPFSILGCVCTVCVRICTEGKTVLGKSLRQCPEIICSQILSVLQMILFF